MSTVKLRHKMTWAAVSTGLDWRALESCEHPSDHLPHQSPVHSYAPDLRGGAVRFLRGRTPLRPTARGPEVYGGNLTLRLPILRINGSVLFEAQNICRAIADRRFAEAHHLARGTAR